VSVSRVVLLDAYVLDDDAIAGASTPEPTLRHARELRGHRPGRLGAPVTLVVASESASLADTLAPRWAQVASVARVDVVATHDSLLAPPALAQVADIVALALALPPDRPDPHA
jgi:thioesterase domain-containing protein